MQQVYELRGFELYESADTGYTSAVCLFIQAVYIPTFLRSILMYIYIYIYIYTGGCKKSLATLKAYIHSFGGLFF
jgi:hypothetical protein